MLLTELDRTSHTLVDHHGQLLSKFVSLVSEALDNSAHRLKSVDWGTYTGGCEYFEDMGKNTTALHRVLVSVLPGSELKDVFSRIIAVINRKVPRHFESVAPTGTVAKRAIVDDVNNTVDSYFRRLPAVDMDQLELEQHFSGKYLGSGAGADTVAKP